jgi:hypothetical protein
MRALCRHGKGDGRVEDAPEMYKKLPDKEGA